jgi:hypothetical protein
MNAIKLKRDGAGWILVGTDFPKHLQVAYGRYILRLMDGPKPRQSIWLRDLPLNLWDLASMGYTYAVSAYGKPN